MVLNRVRFSILRNSAVQYSLFYGSLFRPKFLSGSGRLLRQSEAKLKPEISGAYKMPPYTIAELPLDVVGGFTPPSVLQRFSHDQTGLLGQRRL